MPNRSELEQAERNRGAFSLSLERNISSKIFEKEDTVDKGLFDRTISLSQHIVRWVIEQEMDSFNGEEIKSPIGSICCIKNQGVEVSWIDDSGVIYFKFKKKAENNRLETLVGIIAFEELSNLPKSKPGTSFDEKMMAAITSLDTWVSNIPIHSTSIAHTWTADDDQGIYGYKTEIFEPEPSQYYHSVEDDPVTILRSHDGSPREMFFRRIPLTEEGAIMPGIEPLRLEPQELVNKTHHMIKQALPLDQGDDFLPLPELY